jgi:hypothetical protein
LAIENLREFGYLERALIGSPEIRAPSRSRHPSLAGLRWTLILGGVLVGIYWRLHGVGTSLLFGDELHSLREIPNGYRYLLTHFSPTGSGMALPIFQRALGDALGLNHWTIRGPATLGGIATLASTYPIARRCVGGTAAAVATLLVATSPLLIFYSHFARAYSLVTWLGLLLFVLLQRIVDGDRANLARCAGCAFLTALLPYVQPIWLGFVLPLFGGALIALWMEAPRRREAGAVASSLAAGGLACLLLHLPARRSLSQYVSFATTEEYFGGFGFWDVATLMAGSRGGAVLALVLLLLALAVMVARYRLSRLPLVLGCVGPVVALAVIRPFGDPYAYARYAIPCLPFACIAIGWFVVVAVSRAIPSERGREVGALALGATLAALLFASGPYGVRHTTDGPHGNTYITMFPLPAFDIPWDGAPAFYRELSRSEEVVRIIEVPALVTRTRHLYRNYYLQHGKETWLGIGFPWELKDLPDGPYLSFEDPHWREKSDADYLILHASIGRELSRYWRFVYGTHRAEAGDPSVAAYMARHSRYAGYKGPFASLPAGLREKLRLQLGEPLYLDEEIVVWRLRAAAASNATPQ